MKQWALLSIVLLALLVGCLDEPVSTEFEIIGGYDDTFEVWDVDLPLTEYEASTVAEAACVMYKLMEHHGKRTDETCEYWFFIDIYGDPCDAAAAKVCVDKPLVRCFADGFITNTAVLDGWKCAEGAIDGVKP